MFHFTKKRAVVMAVVGSLALAVGAYAYFTSTGTGSGSATAGTSTPWTVAGSAATGDPLTPGATTEQTMTYTVTNPGSGNQGLRKVTVSVANANGTPWTAVSGCSKDDFSVNGAAAGTAYEDTENAGNIAPAGFVTNTVTIKMVDRPLDQEGCKLAAPPLYLVAS
jgi:hypothetical protein